MPPTRDPLRKVDLPNPRREQGRFPTPQQEYVEHYLRTTGKTPAQEMQGQATVIVYALIAIVLVMAALGALVGYFVIT